MSDAEHRDWALAALKEANQRARLERRRRNAAINARTHKGHGPQKPGTINVGKKPDEPLNLNDTASTLAWLRYYRQAFTSAAGTVRKLLGRDRKKKMRRRTPGFERSEERKTANA